MSETTDDLFTDVISAWDCPPLTDTMVKEAEERFGHRLPSDYIGILKIRNGGILNRSKYRKRYLPYLHTYLSVPMLFGIGGKEGIDVICSDEGVTRGQWLASQLNIDPETSIVISQFSSIGLVLDYSAHQSEPSLLFFYTEEYPKIYLEHIDESIASLFSALKER